MAAIPVDMEEADITIKSASTDLPCNAAVSPVRCSTAADRTHWLPVADSVGYDVGGVPAACPPHFRPAGDASAQVGRP